MAGVLALLAEIGMVVRQEWRWFVGLTLLWVVVFAAGPCHRAAGPVADHDPAPTATAPLSSAALSIPAIRASAPASPVAS